MNITPNNIYIDYFMVGERVRFLFTSCPLNARTVSMKSITSQFLKSYQTKGNKTKDEFYSHRELTMK